MKPPHLILALATLSACVFAQPVSEHLVSEHWVSTWATSPQQPRPFPPLRPPATVASATPPATPAPPRPPAVTGFHNQTLRMIAHTTIGGRRVRIQLSNAFGSAPLAIGAAHIAIRDRDAAILWASDRALLFGGRPACSIPPGATEISDPVDLYFPAAIDLAVSIYLPETATTDNMHAVGLHTTYISKEGDATAAPVFPAATTTQSYYFLTNVDVAAPPNAAAIVTFGDSITDGSVSTPDTDRSWPSFLARRLAASGGANIAVLNQGIAGNQLLRDGAGVNALARFDRDVLAQPGVKWLMILEGINDIGIGSISNMPVSSDDLIAALKQLIERAHEHGIKAIGCTLTPYEGAAYYSESGELVRMAVNQWIRASSNGAGAFDAVVDFEAATRDPDHPKQLRPGFDNGDHLHPNDAGYQAMANAIDLSIFGLTEPRP